MDRTAFAAALAPLGLVLTPAQLDAFASYEDALYRANAVMNLTRVPQSECWLRHFVDSLLAHDLLPRGATVLDVGTGPGLPAWPLACARPDLHVTALDSNGKMLGFLASQPLPNLTPVLQRAEEWGAHEQFDVVTGRAVAPLAIQLEISAPLCRVGGRVVLMRTETDDLSGDPAVFGLARPEAHRRVLPGTDVVRVFPVYTKTAPTPSRYPRRWAEIRARPVKLEG